MGGVRASKSGCRNEARQPAFTPQRALTRLPPSQVPVFAFGQTKTFSFYRCAAPLLLLSPLSCPAAHLVWTHAQCTFTHTLQQRQCQDSWGCMPSLWPSPLVVDASCHRPVPVVVDASCHRPIPNWPLAHGRFVFFPLSSPARPSPPLCSHE